MPLAFFLPKYWVTWVGLAVMRALEPLPYPAQRRVGNAIGMLLRRLPLSYLRSARRNIALCLPELSQSERECLLNRHCESLGMALCETADTWWSSDERLNRLAEVRPEISRQPFRRVRRALAHVATRKRSRQHRRQLFERGIQIVRQGARRCLGRIVDRFLHVLGFLYCLQLRIEHGRLRRSLRLRGGFRRLGVVVRASGAAGDGADRDARRPRIEHREQW